MAVVNTVGRRKTAIARAYMSEGKGVFTINNREAKEYFNSDVLLKVINKPFEVAELTGKYDVNFICWLLCRNRLQGRLLRSPRGCFSHV